jgi:very-short-patch-repair endonuclease
MVKARAKQLRQKATDAERLIWSGLRELKRAGFHFRRQAPFDRFIVDFVCHSRKLVVELDGSQHGSDDAIVYDEKRTAYLNSREYRVVRFGNWEVFQDRDRVIDAIVRIAGLPPPDPSALRYDGSTSPQGGGES